MWIRSQFGKALVDVNQMSITGTRIICNKWTLGEYEDEQKAMDVLDEIHEQLNKGDSVEVFQMPEE